MEENLPFFFRTPAVVDVQLQLNVERASCHLFIRNASSVTVECRGRNPDWLVYIRLLVNKYLSNWTFTNFSMVRATQDVRVIGR